MFPYLNLDWRMIGRASCRRLARQKRAANGANPKNKNCLIKAANATLKRHQRVRCVTSWTKRLEPLQLRFFAANPLAN